MLWHERYPTDNLIVLVPEVPGGGSAYNYFGENWGLGGGPGISMFNSDFKWEFQTYLYDDPAIRDFLNREFGPVE